jgi:hypothetical protein
MLMRIRFYDAYDSLQRWIRRVVLYGIVLSGRCAPQHIKFNIKSTALYRIKWFNTFESQNTLL